MDDIMKALILEDTKKIKLVNIPKPKCNNNEAIIEVAYCSVCRTDAKMWIQGQRDLVLPRVLGHEICGQKSDSNERFIVWPAKKCGKCYYCKNGKENLCNNIQVIGFHKDGGFAQYIKVPKESLIKVPDNLPSEIACMTELMSSGINALEQVDLKKNQKVLIFGGGPAGLLLGLACKYFGAESLIVENNQAKINLSQAFCKKANIAIAQNALGSFDVAINAAPDPKTLLDGITKLSKSRKYCIYSGFIKNISIPTDLLNEVHYKQLTVTGAYGSTKNQMCTALKIFQSNLENIKLLIHKIIRLEEVPSVFPEILSGQALKYVVDLHKH